MKAEKGKSYAQVANGKLHWFFTQADLPEWDEKTFIAVDVTGVNNLEVGDDYDPGKQKFTKPAPPAVHQNKKNLSDAIDALKNDNSVPASVKAAFAALKSMF